MFICEVCECAFVYGKYVCVCEVCECESVCAKCVSVGLSVINV